MEMLNKIAKYIENHQLFNTNDRILVGLSGGADSVVLFDILQRLNFDCIAAHCNFHLRGEASLHDEKFVTEFVKKYDCKHIKIDFDTRAYAEAKKISIEMAARDLRYAWFHEMATKHHCQAIAVAHHGDDSAETLLLNLIRGTGLKGLQGIRPKNGMVVRPLLDCSRSEIEFYAEKRNLAFVHDATNDENEYNRNQIRNQIIPLMAEINPSILFTLNENCKRFSGTLKIYEQAIHEIKEKLLHKKDGKTYIAIDELQTVPDIPTVLYEILHPYGFSNDSIVRIAENLNSQSGLQFYSDKYRLLIDRENLILQALDLEPSTEPIFIEQDQTKVTTPIQLELRTFEKSEQFILSKARETAQLDAEKLQFPLTVRRWQAGDRFYPLGMKGSKKVSDFLVDEKLNRFQKEAVYVLLSDKKIVWVIGMRIDNRFRITDVSKKVLEIHFNSL